MSIRKPRKYMEVMNAKLFFTQKKLRVFERCSTLAVGGRGKLHKAIPAKKKHGKSHYRVLIDR